MTDVADPRLCSWLEDEYHLAMVLKHVIDDGLHECRRVCRKWRDVCGGLSVKLAVVDEANLQLACEMFPNATSAISGTIRDNYREVVGQLGSLEHLRHLIVFPHPEDGPDHGLIELDLFPQSFEKLETLSLRFSDELDLIDLGSSLQYLTNVTKLELIMDADTTLEMEPVTQLSKLKNLRLCFAPLENEEGELLFPLTGLISLRLRLFPQPARKLERILEMIQRETRQLHHFEFSWDCLNSWEDASWSVLSTFSNLKSLGLRGDTGPPLQGVLTNMCRLTQLSIGPIYGHQREDWDSVLSLPGLRSLSFFGQPAESWEATFVLHSFHRLSLLTSLTIESVNPGITLSCLTGLVELKLLELQCNLTDVRKALVHLTNLERFDLSSSVESPAKIESSSLAHLKKLKHLGVREMWLDHNFILTLATLPDLTSLNAIRCGLQEEHVPSFLTQLSFLSSLRTLFFTGGSSYLLNTKPCLYLPEGSMPKLRGLYITCEHVTDNDKRELFRKLPCLRFFDRPDHFHLA